MSPVNFTIVGLRLIAIFYFLEALPLLSSLGLFAAVAVSNSSEHLLSTAIFDALLPGSSLLVLSILLFVFSQPLARWIASPAANEPGENTCTLDQVQSIAFGVVGILILATALPALGRALQGLVDMYTIHRQGGDVPPEQSFRNLLPRLGVIAQFVVGVLLLLNPKGFRNIWRFLRTAGT